MSEPYNSCLTSDRTFYTITFFKQQSLIYDAPGTDMVTAAEFAVVNYLRSFSFFDMAAVVEPILVHVIDRIRETPEQRKKKVPIASYRPVRVQLIPPDPKRRTGPGWSVSAVF